MKQVLIVQSQIKQYRAPFFEKLHAALIQDGIKLRVAYSDPPVREVQKRDNQDLPEEYGVKVKSTWTLRGSVIYQPLLREALAADLVIVEQANKYVLNHFLLLLSALGLKKFAFWGLANNKQEDRLAISEWYKRRTLNRADWWFAYTEGTAHYLMAQGIQSARITAVQNSVDTQEIREASRQLTPEGLAEVRRNLQISREDPVGIYCGMLDPVKGLDFLVKSARLIRTELNSFHLVIIGDGPQRDAITRSVRDDSWIHCVGPKFGREKVALLKMADVLLAPGRVGLVVLDAFAAGLPLLATELPIHGPEIEYLKDGYNGIMTAHETSAYVRATVDLLRDRPRLKTLRAGAASSGEAYSIESMVERFRQGIRSCLDSSKNRFASIQRIRSQQRSIL